MSEKFSPDRFQCADALFRSEPRRSGVTGSGSAANHLSPCEDIENIVRNIFNDRATPQERKQLGQRLHINTLVSIAEIR